MVIEAMRLGRTGNPHSAETRRKMSISQQANRGPNKKAPELPDALKWNKPPIPHARCMGYVITRPVM
jgi:hypothetical protein